MTTRIMRYPEVQARTGLGGRTSIERLEKRGEFPGRVRLGGPGSRAIGWHEAEIEAWLAARPKPGSE